MFEKSIYRRIIINLILNKEPRKIMKSVTKNILLQEEHNKTDFTYIKTKSLYELRCGILT